MQRDIPTVNREQFEAQESGEAILVFATITHPKMEEVISMVEDGGSQSEYELDGITYLNSRFELGLLDDTRNIPKTQFRFQNVDASKVRLLRQIKGAVNVSFKLIAEGFFTRAGNPRTVRTGMVAEPIYTARHLELTEVKINAQDVTGTLQNYDPRGETFPFLRATQEVAPGLYL